ncbi:MAG: DUF429 domain-containing protein [Archaeoglobi archaeon]|nr:DUF429 domain-containing protein [Candidatus Mnemosynella bozhongmuii]
MKILGIDVGVRVSWFVLLKGSKVESSGALKSLPEAEFAGVDAPLSFPAEGAFRECERELLRRGIPLFPSGAPFFQKTVRRGIEIAEELRRGGTEVYEVYPYATRKILGIGAGKRKRKEWREIEEELRSYLTFDELENEHIVDSALCALTVLLYLSGKGELISGKDGEILIPSQRALAR